jgi:polysaccharide chain length determinant protein (PEP-CTERM system associated)
VEDIQKLIAQIWDDVRGSWRFRWWALGAGWLVCAAGWAYVLSMPNIYQANARVYLNTQSALRPLLQGLAVNPDVESDLALVRQALLSRPQMEKVARQTELDLGVRTAEDKERLLAGLQKNIVIQTDSRVRNSTTDGLYRISFQHSNRVQALGVVQRMLDTFVEDTLGTKRTGQEEAQRFLQEQMDALLVKLSSAENNLSEFKKKNVGSMPDDSGDYFARMQSEMTGLEGARMQLRMAEARRDELGRQLSGEEPFVFGFEDNSNQSGGSSKTSGDLSARIQELEGRLGEMLLRYTDKHPEVIAVRNTIGDLRAQQEKEIEKVKRERKVSVGMQQSFKANPIYQSMDMELKRASVQIAELRQDVAQREMGVSELRRKVDSIPEVEAQLKQLTRDYDDDNARYQQLKQRLDTARLSQSADSTGVVNFSIIEPPAVQLEPVSPKRMILLIGVLIAGLGVAAAVAYGANLLHPVFVSAQRLSTVTGVAVIGCIGHAESDAARAKSRTNNLLLSAATAMLLVAFLGIVAFASMDGGRLLEQFLS